MIYFQMEKSKQRHDTIHMVADEHLTFAGLVCCNTFEEQQIKLLMCAMSQKASLLIRMH
jgi:hypothetical protein